MVFCLYESFVLRVEGHEHSIHFRAAMSQAAMLAWTFDECRGGIYRKVYGLRRESAEKPLKTLFLRVFQRA